MSKEKLLCIVQQQKKLILLQNFEFKTTFYLECVTLNNFKNKIIINHIKRIIN
jgi:hypothetical protein